MTSDSPSLFGTRRTPEIPFGIKDLPGKVIATGARMSISGVQIKASVRLSSDEAQLEVVATGGTHVLKPEPDAWPGLPRNEDACMDMAARLGFAVPPHALLPMTDGTLCYVVRRFDRTSSGPLPNETMFQILGSTDKYSGSLELVGKAIRRHVENPGLDAIEFFERSVFCFLIGNGDMHLKNWALVTEGGRVSLAPCYDLVSSRLYLPDEEDSALMINGRRSKIKRADFEALATTLKIEPKAASRSLERLKAAKSQLVDIASNSKLDTQPRESLKAIIADRYSRLFS